MSHCSLQLMRKYRSIERQNGFYKVPQSSKKILGWQLRNCYPW